MGHCGKHKYFHDGMGMPEVPHMWFMVRYATMCVARHTRCAALHLLCKSVFTHGTKPTLPQPPCTHTHRPGSSGSSTKTIHSPG